MDNSMGLRGFATTMQFPVVVCSIWAMAISVAIGHPFRCAGDTVAATAIPQSQPLTELFDENILADNVFAVRRRSARLSETERYDFLLKWVLPSETHATIRMSGAFAPTHAAPIVPEEYLDAAGSGGTLVSPVFDLLDIAAKLGRLEELRERVAEIPMVQGEAQQRAHAAMRILLAMEVNDEATIETELTTLQSFVAAAAPLSMSEIWPQTLVAYRGVTRFPESVACELVATLMSYKIQPGIPAGNMEWQNHIYSLTGRLRIHQTGEQKNAMRSTEQLKNWIPVVRTRFAKNAGGAPIASWWWNGDECEHFTGHDEDYIYYRSPLRGDFDIEMDVRGYGSTQLAVAGAYFGPTTKATEFETGNFRHGIGKFISIEPPFNKFDQWIRCRATLRNGVRSLFINGRLVTTEVLPENHDPWVGFRSWCRAEGKVRNVRISGTPTIPDSVDLIESPNLTGWYPYLDDSPGHKDAYWNCVERDGQPGEILGPWLDWQVGIISERLLSYHRPLVEDGAIEYDFFYEPDKSVTHPAFDRMTFLLTPDGVRIHWVTNEKLDRTELAPDNETDERTNQRGPTALPLTAGTWNHMKVAVAGNIATLALNGTLIFERPLEDSNSRTFGLFNYADRGEVRVRNIVMRGAWPKSLPPAPEQELANSTLALLDVDRSRMAVSMKHDFAASGLPTKYFQVPVLSTEFQITPTANGVTQETRSPGKGIEANTKSLLEMHGDFDVSLGFDEMTTTGHDHYGAALIVNCGSGHRIQVGRRHYKKNDDHGVVVGWLIPAGNGSFFQPTYESIHTEATTGHLRMARRGDTWYVLFAANDSSSYQLVGKQKLEGTENQSAVFEMQSIATDGGTSHVLWKDVQIAADKLMIFPDSLSAPKMGLYVMNADGSDLRQISLDDPNITSPGSPDWSNDGKQIAFDQYSTTSLYLVNADGSGLRKIGSGAMPTFSPDGKRLAFSGGGMSVMDVDGSDIEVLSQDGWGAQWSPNGKWVAYESRQRVGNKLISNITIIDVETKEKRTVLDGDQATRYSQIYWNMEWSPDSMQICFKGKVIGEASEMAITAVAGSSKWFTVVTSDDVVEDFSWHPDGSRIILGKHSPQHAGHRLFLCDPSTKKIMLLETQPMDQKSVSGVWSPDGSQIVFSSVPNPKAVPWKAPVNSAANN